MNLWNEHMLPEFVDIPIFPLPNVTFFPQTLLPLHVFEPRYRKMTANCLSGDRLMGVSLLKEGWQKDYFGRPPICKTFGVGKIVDHEQLKDGRYNIILEGLFRVRLIEEYPTKQYRTARAQVIQDPPIDHCRAQISQVMKDLQTVTGRIAHLMPATREPILAALSSHPHPLIIASQLASALVLDAYDRQSILEQDDPMRRLGLIQIQLRNLAAQLESKVREEMIEEE
jgi:Lon protease-like protein